MISTEDLFKTKGDWACFYDVVADIMTVMQYPFPDDVDGEVLLDLFNALPETTRDIAHSWSLGDTVFRDEAHDHMRRGYTGFSRYVLAQKITGKGIYEIGSAILEGHDIVFVDVYDEPEHAPHKYVRVIMKKTPELLDYLKNCT